MPDSGRTLTDPGLAGSDFAIQAPTLFDGERFLSGHCVIVRGQSIAQVLPAAQCPAALARLILHRGVLAPGFVDLQVNGGGDVMFNNAPTVAALDTLCTAHRAAGTTAMYPTLISDTPAQQRRAVAAVRAARAGGNAGILGIHLEGPHLEAARRGAHHSRMIRPALDSDIDWLCSLNDISTIVTLAPEHAAPQQIERLTASGILVCAGHTGASYAQITRAAAAGLSGITHLFNAMSPLTAREPGAVGAALDDDRLWLGIIADGHHVHPAAIRLAASAQPEGRMVLVSDAMATVGGSSGAFTLYGERICARDGALFNTEGALAGSAIGLIGAVRYAVHGAGLPLAQCLRMASLYPAAIVGLGHRLGRIAAGYRADLVHFDDDFAVRHTWAAGAGMSHSRPAR